jgi:putative ABC transport system substrate-binding protein
MSFSLRGYMQRREFITLIGGAAVMWPLASLAQKAPIVVGFLGSQAPPRSNSSEGGAIVEGFRDNGLIYGRDYVFEERFTGGDDDRFPTFAYELAQKNARIIMANSPAAVRAAQRLDPPVVRYAW